MFEVLLSTTFVMSMLGTSTTSLKVISRLPSSKSKLNDASIGDVVSGVYLSAAIGRDELIPIGTKA